jgi:tetratricopeptide (TPR) repeat protein
VLKYFVPVSLVLGFALVWSAGCQSQPNSGASVPTAAQIKPEVTPRLNASTYFAHGNLLERQGNYEGAVQQYQRALALSSKMTSARNRLGIVLNKLGRHAEASAQFRLAIQQNPKDAYLQNNLGFSLYLEGKYAEALSALSAALELQPDYDRAHMNKGIVLAKTRDYAGALTEFTLTAGEADAHYNLGVIQSELGDYASAARSLEGALKVNPDFDAARQQLHVVARLAAGLETPSAATPAVAADDASVPADAAQAPALVADTDTPLRAAAAAGSETGTVTDRDTGGKHDRKAPAARMARHRRLGQPARPTVSVASAGQDTQMAAYQKAQSELKAEIIRRLVMAKLGQ